VAALWPPRAHTLLQHQDTFALLELKDASSLLHLAGVGVGAEEVDAALIAEALRRHTLLLKERRRQAVVKAESEVLTISGVAAADADAAGLAVGSGGAVDSAQLLAAVDASIARSEQRMQAFVREEMRRAIITISKLDVPRDAPPPPQFSALSGQFRCMFALLVRASCCCRRPLCAPGSLNHVRQATGRRRVMAAIHIPLAFTYAPIQRRRRVGLWFARVISRAGMHRQLLTCAACVYPQQHAALAAAARMMPMPPAERDLNASA
jgi:hypothetical protein